MSGDAVIIPELPFQFLLEFPLHLLDGAAAQQGHEQPAPDPAQQEHNANAWRSGAWCSAATGASCYSRTHGAYSCCWPPLRSAFLVLFAALK